MYEETDGWMDVMRESASEKCNLNAIYVEINTVFIVL